MYPFNASLVGMLDIWLDILKICMKKFNAEKIFFDKFAANFLLYTIVVCLYIEIMHKHK